MEPSAKNSSSSLVSNGSSFVGLFENVFGFNTITVAVKTDQSGVLYVDFSPDGTNADSTLTYTVAASTNEVHRLTVTRQYFRVRFLNNSGSSQTYFRLQSLIGNHPLLTSNLNTTLSDDADAITTRSVLYGRLDSGHYRAMSATDMGHLEVEVHGPRLPFGSIHTESTIAIFQSDFVYGLNDQQQQYGSTLSGSVTSSGGMAVVSTGATSTAQAYLQSRRRLRYRAGQGSIVRFTALFTSPVANSYQVAGVGHSEDGLMFGYVGTTFGILHSYGGKREIQTLTITTASTTNENVTVTLGGVANSVAVTNSANIQRTVWEISQGTYTGWKAYPQGATIVFICDSVGDKTGTFSLVASTAVGAFVETRAGVAATENFIPQSSWNGDVCDGSNSESNPTGFLLDPTKGNVYQIHMQYLGFGPIQFFIEVPLDNNNPHFQMVHAIRILNSQTTPSVSNPSFPFLLAAYSAGSTTNLTVKCASYAGFIEGNKKLHGVRTTFINSLTTVGATNYQALFTIINKRVFNGISNQSVLNMLGVSGAIKHTSPVIFYLIKKGTLTGNPNFVNHSTVSCASYDTAATAVSFSTNDQLIWSGHLGDTGEIDHHFGNGGSEEVTLQPGEYITLAAKATTGSPSWVTGTINIREDH